MWNSLPLCLLGVLEEGICWREMVAIARLRTATCNKLPFSPKVCIFSLFLNFTESFFIALWYLNMLPPSTRAKQFFPFFETIFNGFFPYSRFQEDTICCAVSLQELKSGGYSLDAEGITARQLLGFLFNLGFTTTSAKESFCFLPLGSGCRDY